MIVVHGWWSPRDGDGVLVLWAEDADAPAEPPTRRGRRPRVVDHPFALPAEYLPKVLELPHGTFDTGTAALALPTAGRAPTAAPELGRTAPEPEQLTTAQWRVPVIELDPDAALELLLTEQFPEAGGVLGADVRALRALAGFAADLAARGRVLPTADAAGPGRARAVWRPLVTGSDAEWLRAAVAGLPASLTCEVTSGPVGAQVAAVVDALVDAAVREALGPPRGRRPSRTPAAAWRSALLGTQREFAASAGELAALRSALDDWQRDAVRGGAVRACFRLVEPAGNPESPDDADADGWSLDFALQAAEEPSLVVDAQKVWRGRGLTALRRHAGDPQETLLAELGRAVRLYPAIETALRTARPASLALDTAGAHAFLTETAPLLLGAGFGVILPGWWTRPGARLGARLTASTPSQPGAAARAAGIGQEGLVEFDWQLAVGDHTLSEREVTELLEAHQPLVRVRGQWLQVDADRLARARSFLSRRGRGRSMTVGEVLHALGAPDEGPGGLPVLGVDADGWLGDLLSGEAERRLEPVPAPDGFVGTLRPYQQRGLSWLSFLESVGLGGLLADDMGLGKTVQLLALVARDAGGPDAGPTLLVCPMSVVGNWQREAARFAPGLRVHVHHGAERPRGKAFDEAVAGSDIVVTTYALLARDAAALRKVAWHRVVLDEAQAIKNAATKAAAAARSIPAPRRVAVTGTPVENRLADLWSLMEFANPGVLGKPAE
ncbi:MAG: SNF2-related protein, partial [Actinomycetes bacterium]